MPTRDKIKYPEDPDKILADRSLGPVYRAYCKKAMLTENVNFMDAANKARNYKKLYEDFISAKAKQSLNIAHTMREPARKLADAGDWKNKDWKSIVDDIYVKVSYRLEGNLGAFWLHQMFKDHHAANLRKKLKISDGQLDDLGVDRKNKDELLDMMALFKADKKAGNKAAVTMTKKKRTRLSPKDFVKKVKKLCKV